MSAIAFLRDLLAAGLALDDALIAAEKFEAKQQEVERARIAERRAKDAARKARSRDVTRSHADIAESRGPSPHVGGRSAQVVTPSLSSLPTEVQKEVGGGGGECAGARSDEWPEGKASDHVRLLVETVASPRLDPAKSPGLITTAGRLVAWRRDGASWEHDVVPVVTALCAKQRSPVSTWKFFDQAIARSISDNRAALEIPAHQPRATGPPSLTDRIAAEHAEARRRALAS